MNGGDEACWLEIRRHYEAGVLTVAALCERFGITPGELTARRRREAWPPRPRGRRPGQRVAKRVAKPALSRSQTMIERLYRAIDRELKIIEERMANGVEQSAADTERDARSIGALIRNLEKLTAFDEQNRGGEERAGRIAGVSADEADRIRRDLAARIEKMCREEST